jgi:hypothetical protein
MLFSDFKFDIENYLFLLNLFYNFLHMLENTSESVLWICIQIQKNPWDFAIAGHYRNNPWPSVPDWRRCRNADAGLMMRTNGKITDAGLAFCPAFRYSGTYLSSWKM